MTQSGPNGVSEDIAAQLSQHFPLIDRGLVCTLSGNEALLAAHISESHLLTLAEAREALDDWRTFFAPRSPARIAA